MRQPTHWIAEIARLKAFVERNRRHLLESEVTLINTLCDLAQTEMKLGQRSCSTRLLADAKQAAIAARSHLHKWKASGEKPDELRQRLQFAEQRIARAEEEAA